MAVLTAADAARGEPGPDEVERRLHRHLGQWLGAWPPRRAVEVVTSPARERPGWDGGPSPFAGVRAPEGTVLSVPPDALAALGGPRTAESIESVLPDLRRALGRPDGQLFEGVFRWSDQPADLPDVGIWVPAADPRLPEWLRPFGGEVLAVFDPGGRYAAGLGIKRHDDLGRELAVGTDERHRGRGLARRLVAQAARRVLAEGGVPTYLHGPDNAPSAAVAEAAGFPDRGWRILGIGRGRPT